METTQRGSAIWSYTLRIAGAILLHSVPATIIRSLCRGLGRNSMPKRSMSYRAAPACIISTAQQASPKVIGHSEPVLDQLISLSTDVVTKPSLRTPSMPISTPAGSPRGSAAPPRGAANGCERGGPSSLPVQRALLPLVDEADGED